MSVTRENTSKKLVFIVQTKEVMEPIGDLIRKGTKGKGIWDYLSIGGSGMPGTIKLFKQLDSSSLVETKSNSSRSILNLRPKKNPRKHRMSLQAVWIASVIPKYRTTEQSKKAVNENDATLKHADIIVFVVRKNEGEDKFLLARLNALKQQNKSSNKMPFVFMLRNDDGNDDLDFKKQCDGSKCQWMGIVQSIETLFIGIDQAFHPEEEKSE
jgi:hypothetical protein